MEYICVWELNAVEAQDCITVVVTYHDIPTFKRYVSPFKSEFYLMFCGYNTQMSS